MYIYIYTVVIKKAVPSKYYNISVTWVMSMHRRAWCTFIQKSNIYCKKKIVRLFMPKPNSDD